MHKKINISNNTKSFSLFKDLVSEKVFSVFWHMHGSWNGLSGPFGCLLEPGVLADKPEDCKSWRLTCPEFKICSFPIGMPGAGMSNCNSLQEAQRRAYMLIRNQALLSTQKIL